MKTRRKNKRKKRTDMPTGVYERKVRDPWTRLWEKVNKNGPIPEARPDLGPCWVWTGSINSGGYGQYYTKERPRLVHPVVYEELIGRVPDGLELDHLCRVRKCCNPRHLEPVTRRVNLLRGETTTAKNAAATHCPSGHPYDEKNTYLFRGSRQCRECRRSGLKRRRREKRCL